MAVLNGVWLLGTDGIPHQVPDNEAVIASFVGRGWTVTDLPRDLGPDDEEFQDALAQLRDEAEPQPAEEPEPAQPVAAAPATEKKEVK